MGLCLCTTLNGIIERSQGCYEKPSPRKTEHILSRGPNGLIFLHHAAQKPPLGHPMRPSAEATQPKLGLHRVLCCPPVWLAVRQPVTSPGCGTYTGL